MHVHNEADSRPPAPYANPYIAGLGLGLVLLSAFVIMGRGLGASGAMSSLVAVAVNTVAPEHAAGNEFYQGYLDTPSHPFKTFLMFQVIGVFVGGLVSGAIARRIRRTVEKGPRIGTPARFAFAFGGGALMGLGAKLARGCTSGQALTGGAMLNLGSWAFMLCIFAGAYAFAYFMRKEWT